ncbi:LacI family DNA-binding transcriptional regulator [Arcanobacterium ihumii]|uniref:LacI family DNA-binding transcriptional regulator n=1 Tax=Arcanobacterium ihumii TaxID=2138162 RepID=UPI000F51F67F|nr:LacI family DNA-binding transcriptional regulator [Arcanobacterium ihumii]
MTQLPTLQDVATRAGVSIATASRVLSGTDNVTQRTQNRVRKAVAELNYVPNAKARALRKQSSEVLGLVLPNFHNPFFLELIEKTVIESKAHGYRMVITGGEDTFQESEQLATTKAVDGLLMFGARTNETPNWKLPETFPVVFFDRAPESASTHDIAINHREGARIVTQHLISAGARTLLHITGPNHLGVSSVRLNGFNDAVTEANNKCPDTVLSAETIEGDFSMESGAKAARRYVDTHRGAPAGVFAANDHMAIGAMNELRNLGYEIPNDVLVAGYDGIASTALVQPSLTTLALPIQDMAKQAVTLLINLIENGLDSTGAEPIELTGTLRIGGSTTQL